MGCAHIFDRLLSLALIILRTLVMPAFSFYTDHTLSHWIYKILFLSFSLFIMRRLCCVVFPAIRRLNLRVLSDSVFHVRNLSLVPGSFSAFSVDLFSISFRPSNSIFLALRRK